MDDGLGLEGFGGNETLVDAGGRDVQPRPGTKGPSVWVVPRGMMARVGGTGWVRDAGWLAGPSLVLHCFPTVASIRESSLAETAEVIA